MGRIRAVIDTDVLYAGLYSAQGASFLILRAVEERRLVPVLSTTLLLEYEHVLRRHQGGLNLSDRAVDDVLDGFCNRGEHQKIYYLWRPQLRGPKDDHVLELAVASGSVTIVTHNVRHFDAANAFGIQVAGPFEMIGDLK
jgi:putative PIN family toxin of toxin-antitoxin system